MQSRCNLDAISSACNLERAPTCASTMAIRLSLHLSASDASPAEETSVGRGRRGEHLHALAGLVLGRGDRWRHGRRVEHSHARAEPLRPLEALSPAVRLEAQLLSTFIKSATAPPSATASLYAVFVESAIAQSAFADSSIISSGLPAGNERGNQHAIRGGAQGAIRGPSGSLQAMSEAMSIGELACRRTATNLEAFLDDRAE
jgi:hypothetical protein